VEEVLAKDLCDVIVLKPSAIGSYEALRRIRENARGMKIVISSMFESSIGLSYVAACAAACGDRVAHGLSTSGFFQNDMLRRSLVPYGGRITVPDVSTLAELTA
jgi:O-succinylbenzoate synthase